MKKVLLFLLCVCFITVNTVYALIYANGACLYLDPPCGDPIGSNGGRYASLSLKYLNVMGASSLLKSKSDYSQFLALVELAEMVEVNRATIKQYLVSSLTNLAEAHLYYYLVVIESGNYGYIEERIEKLKEFDFENFANSNSLNGCVFESVECFLKEGDVKGIYRKTYDDLGVLLSRLKAFNDSFDLQNLDAKEMLLINQEFSRLMLFGQYSAMVFREAY
jgi:hypothetical protein